MQEVHEIRLQLHEETKDLTVEQHTEYYRKLAEDAAAKHGIVLKRSEPSRVSTRAAQ
ncbi:MAG: hypothetical protein LBN02_06690 [Oscillospiraceae bacterium]|nr:hypothetical protein [Oscillospiraceae bacterium]